MIANIRASTVPSREFSVLENFRKAVKLEQQKQNSRATAAD